MMTIWWVLGLVVASSKKKTSTLKCTNDDYLALTPEDHFSPIRMFRCLMIVDNNMPEHCNGAFYDSLSKNCTACTFGTLKATYLSCFNNCAETFNSDECMECTSSYVAHWNEKCLGEELDVNTLFPSTITSPIQMFRCLVIQDNDMPSYCDNTFYAGLRSGCVSCTFSTLTTTYFSCFQQCSTDASSAYCQECSQAYLTQWKSTCATAVTIPEITPSSTPSEVPCLESDFTATGGMQEMALDLTACLAVNKTRSIDCMSEEGYTTVPQTCSDCLFSSEAITDSVCASVCTGRPYSGMCQKCIASFVSTTVMRCFTLATFPIAPEASCSAADIKIIGTDATVVPGLVSDCTASAACSMNNAGLTVTGNGVISNKCMDCLAVGNALAGVSCDGLGSCEAAITDCIVTPLSQPADELGSCTINDVSQLAPGSETLVALNSCIYGMSSVKGLQACFDGVAASFTSDCVTCVDKAMSSFNECASHLSCSTINSVGCQSCLTTAYETAFLSCYSTGIEEACTIDEVASIAENEYGLALFQRCILDDPSLPTTCFASSDVFTVSHTPSMGCQKCLGDAIAAICTTACAADSTSSDCAQCTNLMASDITKSCTKNTTLAEGGPAKSAAALVALINFTVMTIILIQL